jgi:hypothetical protein
MVVFFKKLKKLAYKSQIAKLKSKEELNKGNSWRGGKIGGGIVEKEVFKYE